LPYSRGHQRLLVCRVGGGRLLSAGHPGRRDAPPLYPQFGITELNFTWYQLPKAPAIERMMRLAPAGFRFTAKLTRTLTTRSTPASGAARPPCTGRGSRPWCSPASSAPCCCSSRRGLFAIPPAAAISPGSWTNSGPAPGGRVPPRLVGRGPGIRRTGAPPRHSRGGGRAGAARFCFRGSTWSPTRIFSTSASTAQRAGWRSGNLQKQFDYDYRDEELRDWAQGHSAHGGAGRRRGDLLQQPRPRSGPRNAAQLMRLLAERGLTPPFPPAQRESNIPHHAALRARADRKPPDLI